MAFYGKSEKVLGRDGAGILIALALMAALGSAMQLVQPMLLTSLIEQSGHGRVRAAIVLLAVVLAQLTLGIALELGQQWLIQRQTTKCRQAILIKLCGAEVNSDLISAKDHYPVTCSSETATAVSGIIRPVVEIVRNVSLLAGVGVYLATLHPSSLLICAGLLGGGFAIAWSGLSPIKLAGQAAVAANQSFTQKQYSLRDSYDEIRSRLSPTQIVEDTETYKSIRMLKLAALQLLRVKFRFGAPSELLFGLAAPVLAVHAAVVLYPAGTISTEQIVEVFLFAAMAVAPVQAFAGASFNWQYTSTLIDRVESLLTLVEADDGASDSEAPKCPGPTTLSNRSGALVARDLAKSNDGGAVLKPVDFSFPFGGVSTVTGRSGSGKTTLGKILAGVSVQDGGDVEDRFGMMLTPRDLRSAVAYSAQNPGLAAGIYEALSNPPDQLTADCIEALQLQKLVSRTKEIDYFGQSFSGGEAKRLSIAAALAQTKPGILLDEPSNGLNAELVDALAELICKYRNERLWILVSHDERILDLADVSLTIDGSC